MFWIMQEKKNKTKQKFQTKTFSNETSFFGCTEVSLDRLNLSLYLKT